MVALPETAIPVCSVCILSSAHFTQIWRRSWFCFLQMFCTHLARFCFSIAEFVNKVFAVLPEDTVWALLAYPCTGFCHNDVTSTGLVLLVQTIVDYPLVGSHHIPQLLFLHNSPLSQDWHHTAGLPTRSFTCENQIKKKRNRKTWKWIGWDAHRRPAQLWWTYMVVPSELQIHHRRTRPNADRNRGIFRSGLLVLVSRHTRSNMETVGLTTAAVTLTNFNLSWNKFYFKMQKKNTTYQNEKQVSYQNWSHVRVLFMNAELSTPAG